MKKNPFWGVVVLLLLPVAIVAAEEKADKPNIVLIVSDDQGYGDYGFMQHPVIQTPNLDRLADQSLLFTRGYVTTALCSPSLATMLTGMYPHQHGYTGNDPIRGGNRADWVEHFRKLPQLPALLGEAGYMSLHPEKTLDGRGVISGDWKLVITYDGKGEVFLFNLKDDPKEIKNLAPENPTKADELKKIMDEWWNPDTDAMLPNKETMKKDVKRSFSSMQQELQPSKVVSYKTIGERQLKLHIFNPEGFKPTDSRPAYVVIHGGGWRSGTPRRFYPYAASLVPEGFVGISVEYRLTTQATTVFDCVKDGRAAIRYIRRHAGDLGIDPDKIAVGGGSAGGHVALGTALFDSVEHADEDLAVSCQPNALVLLFAVLDTSGKGYGNERIGPEWETISPLHQIRPGMPPTLIFHGDQDNVAPYPILAAFCNKMQTSGNTCELVLEKGGKHGHVNNDMKLFDDAAKKTAGFLRKIFGD